MFSLAFLGVALAGAMLILSVAAYGIVRLIERRRRRGFGAEFELHGAFWLFVLMWAVLLLTAAGWAVWWMLAQ